VVFDRFVETFQVILGVAPVHISKGEVGPQPNGHVIILDGELGSFFIIPVVIADTAGIIGICVIGIILDSLVCIGDRLRVFPGLGGIQRF